MLFDREKCITWLGSVLANISGPAVVQPTDFVEKWRDMVPEAWREHVELTKLRVRKINSLPPTALTNNLGELF